MATMPEASADVAEQSFESEDVMQHLHSLAAQDLPDAKKIVKALPLICRCLSAKPDLKGMYCRVPEGRGLHQTARPPSRNETCSVNPLVCEQVYG